VNSQETNEGQWVTMKEAAEILGVSPSTISRLAAINAIEVKQKRSNRRSKFVNVEQVRRALEEEV
jgi:DNA-binding transcriptional MerR regulator